MSLISHPPYDPYSYANAVPEDYGFSDDGNDINTLFVSGLPDDVKAREIHNLFRRRPDFDYCQLKFTGCGNQQMLRHCSLQCLQSLLGPMVGPSKMISVMFVGHLGELALSGASMATSFASVTGFNFLACFWVCEGENEKVKETLIQGD